MTTKSAINFRTTYILIGTVAVLLAALAIYVWVSDDTKPNPQGILLESFYNIGAKSDQITALEIEKGGTKMVFSRQPDMRWRMVQPIKARADSKLVETVIHELLTAKREEKGVDIMDNLGAHGLDNPSVKITLRRGDRTVTLSLGKVSVGGDQSVVYVLTSDQPKKAQATLKKRLRTLFKEKAPDDADSAAHIRDFDEFRTRKLLCEDISLEEAPTHLNGVRLTVGKKVVHLSRNNPDKVWRFEEPANFGDVETITPGDRDFNPTKIQSLNHLLAAVLSIEVPNPKDFLESPLNLPAIGLDPSNPELLRIDLERNDGLATETLWLSRASAKGDQIYARHGNEDSAALVPGEKSRMLWLFVQDPSDLRDRTLVKLHHDRVDAIDVIQGGKKAFELRKIAGKWKIFEGDKVNDADSTTINGLIGMLSQPRAVKGFPTPGVKDETLGFDKPVAELQIWEDGITEVTKGDPNAKPKVRETPTTRILIGKPDVGDVVFVRRIMGATKIDAKMPLALLTEASRGRLDFLSIALKSFQPNDVLKVVIPRGNDIYEIERAPAGRWKIVAPESKKGKDANPEKIHNLIQAMALMQPLKIVAEAPSVEQLKTLGLDPMKPVQKVVLTIKGETTDRIWHFGNAVAMKENVYAKSNLSDFVVEVSKQFSEIARQGELVDPRLYQIVAAEVEGIRLRGWGDFSGVPLVHLYKRKSGGVWESANKDTPPANGLKLEKLLGTILSPQAETMVMEKGKPTELHGLDVNKGALEITIDLGGGKTIVLTLGNMMTKESKLIYTMFNNDIVTIKADPLLLDVKAKPAALLGAE